jgi:hypothetical protein
MDKLRSIYNYLSMRNYTHFLILGLLCKALIFDVSYATFLLTIPVLAYEGYKTYIKFKTPDPVQHDIAILKRFDALQEDLDRVKSKVNATSLDKNINAQVKRYF